MSFNFKKIFKRKISYKFNEKLFRIEFSELPFLTSIDEMSSDTLEWVNDSAEPIKIIPVISMIKKVVKSLDFFKDKCRVCSPEPK